MRTPSIEEVLFGPQYMARKLRANCILRDRVDKKAKARNKKLRRKAKAIERRRRKVCLRLNQFIEAPSGIFKGIVEKHHLLVNRLYKLGWYTRTPDNWHSSGTRAAFVMRLARQQRSQGQQVLTANERKECGY